MTSLWFTIRLRTWPIRRAIHNLSWLPLWWLRKYVPKSELSWTPAATIRAMARRIMILEGFNQDILKRWGETEETLRAERMSRAADGLSEGQKAWAKDVMGVKFNGSETN